MLTFGAPEGCWVREWEGRYARPEWAGAAPDDAVDDTDAIEATLAAHPAVAFGPGVYLVGGVRVPPGGALVGVGPTTVLRLRDGIVPVGIPDAGISTLTVVRPSAPGGALHVSDLTIDARASANGARADTPAISVDRTSGSVIRGVTFVDVNTMAVWADSRGEDETLDLSILENRIESSLGGGFSFFGNIVGAIVSGNHIAGCADDAIAFQDVPDGLGYPRDVIVSGNVVRDCTARSSVAGPYTSTPSGVRLFGTESAVVTGNVFDGTVGAGVVVTTGVSRRSAHVVVSGNVVRRAGLNAGLGGTVGVPGPGFLVVEADHVTLTGNRSEGSRDGGVFILRSREIQVEGGASVGDGGPAIRIEDSSDVSVAGFRAFYDDLSRSPEPYGFLVVATEAPTERVRLRAITATARRGMVYGVYAVQTRAEDTLYRPDVRVDGAELLGWSALPTNLPRDRVRLLVSATGHAPEASGTVTILAGEPCATVAHGMGGRPSGVVLSGVGGAAFEQGRDAVALRVCRPAAEVPYDGDREVSWYAEL